MCDYLNVCILYAFSGKNGSIAKSGGQGDNVTMESRSEEGDTVALLQHPLQKQLEEKTGTQSSTVLKGTW